MKKLILFKMLLAGVLVMALASCENLNPVENQEENSAKGARTVKLGIQMEPGTKVVLSNDNKFGWEVGDQISVWTGASADAAGSFQSCEVTEEGSSKKITVTIAEGKDRFNYAVYPSGVDPAFTGSDGLSITLPNTYALSAVRDTKTPLPMVAINNKEAASLNFYLVGGMLRLTVKNVPADATGLDIQFPGRKVNGTFTVANPGTAESAIFTQDAASGEDKIRVTFAAGTATDLTINLPLPTGEFQDVYITPVGGATKVAAVRHINAGSYTASRAHAKALTAKMVSFSVASGKKVIFSPGNLQATYNASAKTWTWGFAAHQYDRIGSAPGNTTITTETKESSAPYAKLSSDGTVDLFGRSTASTYYGIATTSTASYYNLAFKDWGNLDIDGNGENYWFTLSKDEWCYLTGRYTSRGNGGTVGGVDNALATKAVITEIGMKGFVIFPDHYSGLTPAGVTWSAGSIQDGSYKNSEKGFATTIATLEAWEALEAEGCVFLPVTGTRLGTNVYFNYSNYEDWSCYWSCTDDGNAKVLRFNSDGFDPNQEWNNRHYGESVRLVHEL